MTPYQIFLASLMFVTGSINTLSTKWADKQEAEGRIVGLVHAFDHPFLQAAGMFLGEMSCLAMFYLVKLYKQRRGDHMELGNQAFRPIIFLPAALLDMCGTSLMYIGLNLTYASSFQMLRGAVIIFTALLSVAFLGRTIKWVGWLGMLFVIGGLTVVGLADILFNSHDLTNVNGIIAGDLLIIMAQIVVATQMVYEERFVLKHNIPALQAVGWEGVFGFSVLSVLLIPFYFINAGTFSSIPEHKLEDAIDAFIQMGNNNIIIVATIGNILSIAFFNFSGISVTREMSATTRMVLDSLRTIAIWAVSLAVKWQNFQYLQLVGFALLLVGMFLYNEVIIVPGINWIRRKVAEQRGQGHAVLVNEEDAVENTDRSLIA